MIPQHAEGMDCAGLRPLVSVYFPPQTESIDLLPQDKIPLLALLRKSG
jgi:hypothetical protein